jgi:SAM-dependent methyltransferase
MTGPTLLHPDKAEAIQQWDNDPCGSVGEPKPDDPTYWQRVERNRYESYAPWMREALGFDRYPGKRVLEVGFGLGTDLMQFARAGSQVFGIDITPRHVELASRRFRAFGIPAFLIRGDAEQLPYRAGAFDAVYSFGALHHTPDISAAIREIHRVLQPGGTLTLVTYHRWSLHFLYNTLWYRGLREGGLFREDWRTFLSRIETRDPSNTSRPRVDLFSRRQLRRHCRMFRHLTLMTRHIGLDVHPPRVSDGYVKRLAKRVYFGAKDRLEWRFGWYLIAGAIK